MEDLSDFIEQVYEDKDCAPGEFTLNRERQEKLLRNALKDGLDNYSVHLLAAATLAKSKTLTVKRTESAAGPLGFFSQTDTSFSFDCDPIPFTALGAMPNPLEHRENRFLFRLSLAVNQIALTNSINFRLDSFGEFTVTTLVFQAGTWSVEQNPRHLQEELLGVRVTLYRAPSFFGRQALRAASRFSEVEVVWDEEVMGDRFKRYLSQGSLWSRQWQNERYPLPLLTRDVVSGAEVSAAAFVVDSLNQRSALVCLKDNTPLPVIELLPKDAPDHFVPGLVLILNCPGYQVDASQGKLVRNASLYRVVDDVLARVRASFSKLCCNQNSAILEHLQHFAKQSGSSDPLDEAKSLSPSSFEARTFQFESGYSCLSLGRLSPNLEWLLLYDSSKIGLISLKGHPTVWEVLKQGYLEAIDIHPTSAVVAKAYHKGLLVRNHISGEILFEQRLLGISSLKFSATGALLAVITKSANATRAWVFHTQEWEKQFQFIDLESSEVGFWGDYVFVREKSGNAKLYPFDSLEAPIGINLKIDSRLMRYQLSPDRQYAALQLETGSRLIHLPTGLARSFQGRPITFGEKSDYLISTAPGNRHLIYGLPELNLLHQVTREVDLIYSDGTALKGPKARTLGAIIHPNALLHLNRWEFKEPTTQEKSFKLLDTSRGTNTSPSQPRVSLYPIPNQVGKSQTVLAMRKGTEWKPLAEFTDPVCSLAPHRFHWEALSGVFSFDRSSGELRFLEGCRLSGSVILKKQSKGVAVVAASTGLVANRRLRIAPPSQANISNAVRLYERFQNYAHGNSLILVDSELGTYRSVGRADSTQTNGEWTVRIKRPLLSARKLQFRRNAQRWRTLTAVPGAQLHSHDPVVIFPTVASFGVKKLVVEHFGPMDRGEPLPSRSKSTRIQLSPKGRYVAIHTATESGIADYETGEWLCTFYAHCLSSNRPKGPVYPRGHWVNEFTYLHSGHLLRSSDTDAWSRYQRHPLGSHDHIVSDGQSDIICIIRDGLTDFFDLKSLQVLATLHITGDRWFVFCEDGRWDSSEEEPIGVKPTPDHNKRVRDLLHSVIGV